MAGGILNMVMRSGTNQYHGDIFEYVRNNVIDARAFFDQEKLKLNRHQFGATFHGPVRLPKLYNGRDRTFFMFSWESYRQLVGVTTITHVPSLLERAGRLLAVLQSDTANATHRDGPAGQNSVSRQPGPRLRFHPIAVKLMAYYSLPNRADRRNNYITATNTPRATGTASSLSSTIASTRRTAWPTATRTGANHSPESLRRQRRGNFGERIQTTGR